jgi:hypothetical protein
MQFLMIHFGYQSFITSYLILIQGLLILISQSRVDSEEYVLEWKKALNMDNMLEV